MDKPDGKKTNKNRKASARSKSGKKRVAEGPSCSMFLVELSRKLAQKRKEEENTPKNVVHSIIESITNALPIIFSRRSSQLNQSPVAIETLQELAPELQRNDLLEIAPPILEIVDNTDEEVHEVYKKKLHLPKMPVMTSDVFKQKRYVPTEDVAVNTSSHHDVATNIARYVDTLKKISLIAEEFNQKTAKNLKDIVDSVQEDLKVKLEELQMEQKLMKVDQPMQVEQEDLERAGPSK